MTLCRSHKWSRAALHRLHGAIQAEIQSLEIQSFHRLKFSRYQREV